jgi:hypothetical protein
MNRNYDISSIMNVHPDLSQNSPKSDIKFTLSQKKEKIENKSIGPN